MSDNLDSIKILYSKNLNKLNFSLPISLAIDSNVNIKTILDINSYIYDEKVECGNGKAIVTGKVGIKVIYIDTDNITNTISGTQNFSETYTDTSITNDSIMMLSRPNVVNTILSQDGSLKVNLDITFSPIMYINLALPNIASGYENMIVKKSEINTSTLVSPVDARFEYQTNIETKDNVSKVLGYDCQFAQSKVTAYDEYAVVEGKLYSTLIYETTQNDESRLKEITDSFNIKVEVSMPNINNEHQLDLTCMLDKSRENITTELEDDNTIITIKHEFKAQGVILKNISLDMVEDLFSVDNEVDLTTSSREYNKQVSHECITDTISGESSLDDNDTAIDEIVSNHNISTEITNTYIKNDTLFLEGIITSHVIYIDENKECQHKQTELPFILNTKLQMTKLDCVHSDVSVVDCKTKAKRGTIIELEYTLSVCLNIYQRDSKDIIDNLTIGKSLDFSAYDYQIFIAKPSESMWELCKRIKISMEDLNALNRDLPLVMQGGEKIIIKR